MKEHGTIYDDEWNKTLEEMDDDEMEWEIKSQRSYEDTQKQLDAKRYAKLQKEIKKMANDTKNKRTPRYNSTSGV
jgi:hypothetical protein